jgi:hypothetical protein
MSIDRRKFFKAMGITGLTIMGFESSGAPGSNDEETEFYGVCMIPVYASGAGPVKKPVQKHTIFPFRRMKWNPEC